MRGWFIACTIAMVSGPAALDAQTVDIYLFDIRNEYHLVTHITSPSGYDSQPSFTTDSKALLFSSDRAGSQTDIYRYEITTGVTTNLTNTASENEYSGKPWGADGFMYVLQEGTPYQNVWYRPWDQGGAPQRVLTSYIPVGYFVRNRTGVLFWGRYTYSLFFEPAGSQEPRGGEDLFLLHQAGTSIHAIPGGDLFSFVHKQADWRWVIKSFDPASKAIVPVVAIPSSNEAYCWTPSGVLLTAVGTVMRKFEPRVDTRWQNLVALSAPGLVKGGGCAVSADGQFLALVNTRSP